jgi:hypothetical protein
MTPKERVYQWRRLNPEKWRAADKAQKARRRARGHKSPSDSPARSKARVYASRALKRFGRGSSSIASHVRKTAKDKNTSFVEELVEFFTHATAAQRTQKIEAKWKWLCEQNSPRKEVAP